MLVVIEHYLSMAGLDLYDEEGQGLIEYVLIAALISIAVIGGMTLLRGQIGTTFGAIQTAITPVTP